MKTINLNGLLSPETVINLRRKIKELPANTTVLVLCDCVNCVRDIPEFFINNGHVLIFADYKGGIYSFKVRLSS